MPKRLATSVFSTPLEKWEEASLAVGVEAPRSRPFVLEKSSLERHLTHLCQSEPQAVTVQVAPLVPSWAGPAT